MSSREVVELLERVYREGTDPNLSRDLGMYILTSQQELELLRGQVIELQKLLDRQNSRISKVVKTLTTTELDTLWE